MEAYARLPWALRALHAVSLGLVAVTIVLLVAPAAYHRLAERGSNSERLHRFASWVVGTALIPLGLAICLDFYLLLRATGAARALALGCASGIFLVYAGLWFVIP